MERFVISNIKGVDTTTDPRLLEDNVLARFINGYLQQDGAVSRIKLRGGLQAETDVITANVTASVLKGWMVRDDNGHTRRYFATTEGVYYDNDGSLGTVYNDTVSQIGGVVRYGDTMVIVDGRAPKLVRDLFAAPTTTTLVLEPPDVSGITITSGAPSITKTKAYVMTYYTADGVESPPSVRFGTAVETSGTLTFSNLPIPTDPKIVGKRIYRAVKSVFYKVVDLAKSETTYTDTISDDDLDYAVTPNYLVNLQTAKYGLLHKNRLFLANVSYKDISPYNLLYLSTLNPYVITVRENNIDIPATDRVGCLHQPQIVVYNFNTGNPQIDRRTVYLPYMHITVNMDSGGIAGTPDGKFVEYKIYLRTADGRYSDVVLSTSVKVANINDGIGRDYFEVKLRNLWTAFFGEDRYQPFPEHTYLEVYATSLQHPNKYRRVATVVYNPSIFDGGQNDVVDNGSAEADNLTLPTINVAETYNYPSGVVYSDPEQLGLLLYGNKFLVESEVGGNIQGLAETTDGVWILKEAAIYKIFTESLPASWRLYKISDIGATYSGSIAARKGLVAFIYHGSIYLLSDEGLKEIGYPIRNELNLALNSGYIPTSAIISDKFIVFQLSKTSPQDNQLFVYDFALNVWYLWTGGMLTGGTFGSSVLYENIKNTGIGQIGILVEYGDIGYRFFTFNETATTDSGIIYEMTIVTKALDAGTDYVRPVAIKVRGDNLSNIIGYLNDIVINITSLPSVIKITNDFPQKFAHSVQLKFVGRIVTFDALIMDYMIRKGL